MFWSLSVQYSELLSIFMMCKKLVLNNYHHPLQAFLVSLTRSINKLRNLKKKTQLILFEYCL